MERLPHCDAKCFRLLLLCIDRCEIDARVHYLIEFAIFFFIFWLRLFCFFIHSNNRIVKSYDHLFVCDTSTKPRKTDLKSMNKISTMKHTNCHRYVVQWQKKKKIYIEIEWKRQTQQYQLYRNDFGSMWVHTWRQRKNRPKQRGKKRANSNVCRSVYTIGVAST